MSNLFDIQSMQLFLGRYLIFDVFILMKSTGYFIYESWTSKNQFRGRITTKWFKV